MSQYLSHICIFSHSLNILLNKAFRTDQISLLFLFWGYCVIVVLFKMIFSTPYIVCFHSDSSLCQSCILDFLSCQMISGSVSIVELRIWKSTRISEVRQGFGYKHVYKINLAKNFCKSFWLKISANHYLINFLKRKFHCPSRQGWGCLNLLRGAEHTNAGPSQFSMCRFPLRSLLSSCFMTMNCVYCLQQDAISNSPESKPPA